MSPVFYPERDGDFTTIFCRTCGAQIARYRRERPDDRTARRIHRCPKKEAAA